MNASESNRLLELGRAAYDRGDFQEAQAHFKTSQAARVFPDPVIQTEIGLSLAQLHEYNEAIHYYTNALHLDNNPITRLNRGFAFIGAGRWQEAKTDAEQALEQIVLTNLAPEKRVEANEILAYAEAKLEHHEAALNHIDLAVSGVNASNASGNWVQRMTNLVDMVNEVRRGKGTSEQIVVFPALGKMTQGLAWLETGDLQRAHILLKKGQALHHGDSWFLESAMAKVSSQLGLENQAKGHSVRAVMLRDHARSQKGKDAVQQALLKCSLEESSSTTYGAHQWSTCPKEQVNLPQHASDTVEALREAEARAREEDRFREIASLFQEGKNRQSATPIPTPTAEPWQQPTPTAPPPLPTPTPWLLELTNNEAPAITPIPLGTPIPPITATRIQPAITNLTPKTVTGADGQSYTLRPLPGRPLQGDNTPIKEQDKLSTIADLSNAEWLEQKYPDVAAKIKALPWVRDGTTPHEVETIQELLHLMHALNQGFPAGTRTFGIPILEQPFLQHRSAGDHTAIQSLHWTARQDINLLNHILTHPGFAESGFTDEWTPVLSILHQAADEDPASIDKWLDPRKISIQSQVIQLPLRGEVQLNILRTRSDGPDKAMAHMVRAARYLEDFMGHPFPVDQVNMVYADELVLQGFAGVNFGTGFSMKREIEKKPDHEANTIVHEMAHYYWAGMEDWVDEGMAELHAAHYKNLHLGARLEPSEYPCGEVKNISQLAGRGAQRGEPIFKCNYTLGERLFLELMNHLGGQNFAQKAKLLYLKALKNDKLNEDKQAHSRRPVPNAGIDDVREAFDNHPVVEKWFSASNPSIDMLEEGGAPTWTLPGVAARIHDVGITKDVDQPELASVQRNERDTIYGFIKYSQERGHGTPWEVNLILEEYYLEERYRANRAITLTGEGNTVGGGINFSVGPAKNRKWEIGWHRAILYDETGAKVAELAWEVTP